MEPCVSSCIYLTCLYGICVKIFIMNRYIFSKSYTTSKNPIDRQYTEQGQLQCRLLLVLAKDAQIMASERKFTVCSCNVVPRTQKVPQKMEVVLLTTNHLLERVSTLKWRRERDSSQFHRIISIKRKLSFGGKPQMTIYGIKLLQ